MSRSTPKGKRYTSPITADERMADKLLRAAKLMVKAGMPCPISQADLVKVKAKRDHLRQLRGYGSERIKRNNWVTDLLENWDKPRGLVIRAWLNEQLMRLQERGFKPRTERRV